MHAGQGLTRARLARVFRGQGRRGRFLRVHKGPLLRQRRGQRGGERRACEPQRGGTVRGPSLGSSWLEVLLLEASLLGSYAFGAPIPVIASRRAAMMARTRFARGSPGKAARNSS